MKTDLNVCHIYRDGDDDNSWNKQRPLNTVSTDERNSLHFYSFHVSKIDMKDFRRPPKTLRPKRYINLQLEFPPSCAMHVCTARTTNLQTFDFATLREDKKANFSATTKPYMMRRKPGC